MPDELKEHCRDCGTELPLDGKYIVRHSIVGIDRLDQVGHSRNPRLETVTQLDLMEVETTTIVRATYFGIGFMCPGGGKRSREFKDQAKQTKYKKHNAKVAAAPNEASVAYDIWMEGREIDVEEFVKLALVEYKRLFSSSWQLQAKVHTYRTARTSGGDWRSHKMDVYCSFCGGLLAPRISTAANPEAFPKVKTHPVGCALLCLAGRREFMPPTHRGLIDEDREFAE